MFNTKTLEGGWFDDGEDTTGYTDKVPPDTAHIWDEELGEWIMSEPEIVEETELVDNNFLAETSEDDNSEKELSPDTEITY